MLSRRLSITILVLIALAAPGSLFLFQKDVATLPPVEGGLTRVEAVRIAVSMARGFRAESVTNLRVVRTAWGAVDDAMGQYTSESRSLPVWVVSMKVTGRMVLPGGLPGTTTYFDNFYVILDVESGRRKAFGAEHQGQLIVPPR